MADFIFDSMVALNPATGQLVRGSSGQVFAPDDLATPLEIFDLNGNPKSLILISEQGLTEPFITVDVPRVVFISGDYQFTITSYSSLVLAAETASAAAIDAQQSAEEMIERTVQYPATGVIRLPRQYVFATKTEALAAGVAMGGFVDGDLVAIEDPGA